jgi:hypothetical protein
LKSFLKIGLIQTVNANGFAPIGSVNKFIIADVNANVTDRFSGPEKNQIAFNQFIAVHPNTNVGLLTRGSRQGDVE